MNRNLRPHQIALLSTYAAACVVVFLDLFVFFPH